MKLRPRICDLLWIVLAEGAGALSGWLSREGIENYGDAVYRPFLSPPAMVFPAVWAVLYLLMGIGIAMVRRTPASTERKRATVLWLAQLAVNVLWAPMFFLWNAYGAALLWLIALWLLVLEMVRSFQALDRTAAKLQIPYLAWLTFAGYLNFSVWMNS